MNQDLKLLKKTEQKLAKNIPLSDSEVEALKGITTVEMTFKQAKKLSNVFQYIRKLNKKQLIS